MAQNGLPQCRRTTQEAHASAEQRGAAAEKSVRGIQRELADLEAAVRAQAGQDAARAQAAADKQLTVMRAELKVRSGTSTWVLLLAPALTGMLQAPRGEFNVHDRSSQTARSLQDLIVL